MFVTARFPKGTRVFLIQLGAQVKGSLIIATAAESEREMKARSKDLYRVCNGHHATFEPDDFSGAVVQTSRAVSNVIQDFGIFRCNALSKYIQLLAIIFVACAKHCDNMLRAGRSRVRHPMR
jgi:hypothetical protein